MARHPSVTSQLPAPIRLYGRRVTLRPLTPGDFAEWSEVRRRNESWLAAVGAAPAAGAARPVAEPRGVQRPLRGARPRRGGRRRLRVRRVRRPPALGRGQPQPRRARGDAERHDRLLDRPGARRAQPDRRERGRRRRLRLRAARAASPRDLHRAAQPQQPAGDGEAGASARRASPSASSRSTACGRTTSATASPSRSGPSAAPSWRATGSSYSTASDRLDARLAGGACGASTS